MAVRKKKLPSGMEAFPLDIKMKKPARIAAFLDWWAKKQQLEYVAYNQLLQVIEGYQSLPNAKSPEVKAIRTQVRRAEDLLNDVYGRGIVRHRWFGVRATADDFDRLKNRHVKKAKVLKTAMISFEKEAEHIDISKIPNTPETRPYKDWFNRGTKHILALANDPAFMNHLLPAALEEKITITAPPQTAKNDKK